MIGLQVRKIQPFHNTSDRKQTWRCQLSVAGRSFSTAQCQSCSPPCWSLFENVSVFTFVCSFWGWPPNPGSPLVTAESSAASPASELGGWLLLWNLPRWVLEPQGIICCSRKREKRKNPRNSQTIVESVCTANTLTEGLTWEEAATTNTANMKHQVLGRWSTGSSVLLDPKQLLQFKACWWSHNTLMFKTSSQPIQRQLIHFFFSFILL